MRSSNNPPIDKQLNFMIVDSIHHYKTIMRTKATYPKRACSKRPGKCCSSHFSVKSWKIRQSRSEKGIMTHLSNMTTLLWGCWDATLQQQGCSALSTGLVKNITLFSRIWNYWKKILDANCGVAIISAVFVVFFSKSCLSPLFIWKGIWSHTLVRASRAPSIGLEERKSSLCKYAFTLTWPLEVSHGLII